MTPRGTRPRQARRGDAALRDLDLADGSVRNGAWANTSEEWKTADYRPRIRAQGIDVVRYAPGPPTGVWMPDFGLHVHLLTSARLEKPMHLCDGDTSTAKVTLASALSQWMLGQENPDVVSGYERPSGLTWRSSASCK